MFAELNLCGRLFIGLNLYWIFTMDLIQGYQSY